MTQRPHRQTDNRQPRAIDQRLFRNTLGSFATGVTIITTELDGEVHGMTANAFMSVSLEPPLIVVSIDHRARLHGALKLGDRYGVSLLAENQRALSQHFGGRPDPNVRARFCRLDDTPLIDQAVAYIIARVVDIHPAGDHTLFIGEVDQLEYTDRRPLLFHRGRYRQLDLFTFDDAEDDEYAHATWLGW